MTKTVGLGLALAGAAAGILSSAVLYLVIVGLGSLLAGDSGGEPPLMMRALSFALTFGLLTAGHWSLGIARSRFADDRSAMLDGESSDSRLCRNWPRTRRDRRPLGRDDRKPPRWESRFSSSPHGLS